MNQEDDFGCNIRRDLGSGRVVILQSDTTILVTAYLKISLQQHNDDNIMIIIIF